jgi:hypothetical protein
MGNRVQRRPKLERSGFQGVLRPGQPLVVVRITARRGRIPIRQTGLAIPDQTLWHKSVGTLSLGLRRSLNLWVI